MRRVSVDEGHHRRLRDATHPCAVPWWDLRSSRHRWVEVPVALWKCERCDLYRQDFWPGAWSHFRLEEVTE